MSATMESNDLANDNRRNSNSAQLHTEADPNRQAPIRCASISRPAGRTAIQTRSAHHGFRSIARAILADTRGDRDRHRSLGGGGMTNSCENRE